MPDHLHILVQGTSGATDARRFVAVFKQVSGFHFRQETGGRLWQEGYYDHVLRSEDVVISVVRYIVLNPVRAGICADPAAYPLLGSSRYELRHLLTAADWYPPLG
jgi:REP element-mobilizing transposase RayT